MKKYKTHHIHALEVDRRGEGDDREGFFGFCLRVRLSNDLDNLVAGIEYFILKIFEILI